MTRTKARYFGRHDGLYSTSYPTWLFTISGKDEHSLTNDDYELLGALSKAIDEWLLECGYLRKHRSAIVDCGGVWVSYTGSYGVGEWKRDVLDAYKNWKSSR